MDCPLGMKHVGKDDFHFSKMYLRPGTRGEAVQQKGNGSFKKGWLYWSNC